MAQNRRKRRKNRIFKLGGAAVILLLLLAFLLLFRVSKVQIYGNERYAAEEITSGLLDNVFLKNTLYVLWRYRDGEVPDNMCYLSSLHVQLKSPGHIDVHVTEKKPVAYVDKNGYAYIDQTGIVLEYSDQVYSGVPIVTGVAVEEPVLYQKLPTQSSAQLRTILSLTQLLSEQEVSVDEIRFGENMDITIYVGYIEIQLGQDEYLEEKVANLAKILLRLEGQSGVLHLENFTGRNEQVPFTPAGEVTGQEGGSGDGSGDSGEDGSGGSDSSGDGQSDGPGGSGDGQSGGSDGSGDGQADGSDGSGDGQADGSDGSGDENQDTGTIYPMVFNSSGTLVYNVHVENGTVVDEYGNPVPGVTINENGNVVDAYMNVFDPATGELIQ